MTHKMLLHLRPYIEQLVFQRGHVRIRRTFLLEFTANDGTLAAVPGPLVGFVFMSTELLAKLITRVNWIAGVGLVEGRGRPFLA